MSETKGLEEELREIFLNVFTRNCAIEESNITAEEVRTIKEIEIHEVLENLKDILNSLLEFKQDYINSDKAELVKRSEQFETMLQKSEAEVRSHIRIEHQLKLHIENNQTHSEDLEIQNNRNLKEIKELQEKVKNTNKSKLNRKESKEYLEKIAKLEENLTRKEVFIGRLEKELVRMQNSENERLGMKKNMGRADEEYGEMKRKFEEKAVGLQKLQKMVKETSVKPLRDRGKLIRKSINDNDVSRSQIGEIKISKIFGKSHIRSISEHRPKSVGKRPPSC